MKKVFIIAAIFCAAFSANAQAKPADQPKDTAIYYIIGTQDEFQLLYRAIIAPMDVTPNQQKALAGWIERLKDGRFTLDTLVYYNFRIKPDTIPAKLLVSNTYKKQSSGVWVINGFIVTNFLGTTAYLGRKRKLIPKYIHVWNYITTK